MDKLNTETIRDNKIWIKYDGKPRCCCGKMAITEPFVTNNYMHEPLGKTDAFCGPLYKHDIRDMTARIKELEIENKKLKEELYSK